MRGRGLAGLVLLVLLALAPAALGDTPPPGPPAPPPPAVPPPPPPGVIAPGVSIAGVDVSGQTQEAARRTILAALVAPKLRPLLFTFKGRRLRVSPGRAGYVADIDYALQAALTFGHTQPAPARVDVPLPQRIDRERIRALLAARASALEVPPRDASRAFVDARPIVRRARAGWLIDRAGAATLMSRAFLDHTAERYRLPGHRQLPAATGIGPTIVINRETLRLTLYEESRVARSFPVATGQAAYPTPRGLYEIVTKQRNPSWFPPSSPWARGLGPIPAGPGNPLGTRWMGTSAPAVGIHGTNAPSTIGTHASHGCIRMYVHDAEWLYDHIWVGTPVLIV